jgi:hypothetical protein
MKVTRVPPPQAPKPKKPTKRKPEPLPEPLPEEQVAGDRIGARFEGASRALTFLNALATAETLPPPTLRRAPEGAFWVEVAAPWKDAAHWVWQSGGRPFARSGDGWVPASFLGNPPAATAVRRPPLDVRSWPEIDLAQLLAAATLHPTRLAASEAVCAHVPGPLGRWVLHRAFALGVEVAVARARRRPLSGEGPEGSILLLRLWTARGAVPRALVDAIGRLPHAMVTLPAGSGGERLWVDVRYRLPLPLAFLDSMIPEGETWVLGAPDGGHWRLRVQGREVDGATFLEAPPVAVTNGPAAAEAVLPRPGPVRVVLDRQAQAAVDAVLVDDAQLDSVRRFLSSRPVGEACFLVPGPGQHILTAPGGLPASLPFGIPLVRLGPGALYVEVGVRFQPALPEAARQELFPLDGKRAVVVTATRGDGGQLEGAAYGFDLGRIVPAWSLWTGAPPEVRAGLSPAGEALLRVVSEAIRDVEAQQQAVLPAQRPAGGIPGRAVSQLEVLKQAELAEMNGDLLRAAELLESAGDLGRAGRLYERAAREGRGRPRRRTQA